ncbi:MAG: hypothetical protein IKO15_05610 [Clostridiales bacterium]|nr:hypothetical protein [Clostridiales bacterium]
MSANEQPAVFRKKTLDRISSPEDLTDYLKVTNPGVWVVLAAVIVLLCGIFVWSCVGTLETKEKASVIVEDHSAIVVLTDSNVLKEGMPLRVSTEEVTIASVYSDEYGRLVGKAEIALPDGTYEGTLITDQTHPIDFLTKAGNV